MLKNGTLREKLEAMVLKLERQMREIPVSPELALYLSDAVACGRVSYKAFIGDLSQEDLITLEKHVMFFWRYVDCRIRSPRI